MTMMIKLCFRLGVAIATTILALTPITLIWVAYALFHWSVATVLLVTLGAVIYYVLTNEDLGNRLD